MDLSYFTKELGQIPELFIGVVLIYAALLIIIKFSGLKSFSKMSSYDFVHTIATGSLIAASVTTGTPSLLGGIIIIAMMFLVKMAISRLKLNSELARDFIDNDPLMIMRDGKVLHDNLHKARMTEGELRGKLREANVLQLSSVKAAVLETTGDVSVLHGEDNTEIDDYLLVGVDLK